MPACAQTFPQLLLQLHDGGCDGDRLRRVTDANLFAMQLYSGLFAGSGKSTLAHEIGTASLMLRHGGSFDLILAAMVHGAYLVGDWGQYRLRITASKRQALRSVVGPRAELYVYEFTRQAWDAESIAVLARRAGELAEVERDVIFLRLVEELERLLDYGAIICFRHAEPMKAWLRQCRNDLCEMAEKVGCPVLATELAAAIDSTLAAELPAEIMGLAFPGPIAFRTVPRSYRKRVGLSLYQTVAGQARRIERALRSRLSPASVASEARIGWRRP